MHTRINKYNRFEPPKGDSKHVSPLGNDNAQMPAINISEGFNLGFVGVNQVKDH